jgi:hypothetical protein
MSRTYLFVWYFLRTILAVFFDAEALSPSFCCRCVLFRYEDCFPNLSLSPLLILDYY